MLFILKNLNQYFLELTIITCLVLRYLVAEKGILHRDVSWSNVLINPEEYPERTSNDEDQESISRGAQCVLGGCGGMVDGAIDCGIGHEFRFISDIFKESR